MNEFIDQSKKIHCPICQSNSSHTFTKINESRVEHTVVDDGCVVSCGENWGVTLHYKCGDCEFEWIMHKADLESAEVW